MKYAWSIFFIVVIGLVVWWAKSGTVATPLPEPSPVEATETLEEDLSTEEAPIIKTKKQTKNGMTIETTKEGTGEAITNGKTAVVDYLGKLVDGTVFDASAPRGQTFSFPLGAGMVIKGWDQGVLGMKVGETRVLTIPPELAYGAQGAGGVIPPNATLIFEVTLQAIK
jgi:FKBP-type peptidyl-prolyl cis-trans isomerase FkpA